MLLQMFRTMLSDNTELSDEKIDELANAFMDAQEKNLKDMIFQVPSLSLRNHYETLICKHLRLPLHILQ